MPNIEGIRALFEEMLEGEKAEYLSKYTGADGIPHPAMLTRWMRTENDYRKRFADLLGPPAPSRGMLPIITVVYPGNERHGGKGRIGDGPVENMCYCCGRLSSEHTPAVGGKGKCPPREIIP